MLRSGDEGGPWCGSDLFPFIPVCFLQFRTMKGNTLVFVYIPFLDSVPFHEYLHTEYL